MQARTFALQSFELNTKRARSPNLSGTAPAEAIAGTHASGVLHRGKQTILNRAFACSLIRIRHAEGVRTDYFFAGDVAADGLAFAAADDDAAGVAAAAFVAAGDVAGRNPRFVGLFSMLAARLLSIFAARVATSTSAAFTISFR
jgi:hypothetical protein